MLVMSILNVTPDSFSDGGKYDSFDAAAHRFKELCDSGADIIDIGAESTSPFSQRISQEEELARLKDILPAVIPSSPVPVSVDTYKTGVARFALECGAAMINDVSGGALSEGMLELICAEKPYYICGHIYNNELHSADGIHNTDCIASRLEERAHRLIDSGFPGDKLILDPGFGFGKSVSENIELFRNIDKIRSLGFRVCCGVSRKRFIKDICGSTPQELLGGSIAASLLLCSKNIDIIRVHDTAQTAAALKLYNLFRNKE